MLAADGREPVIGRTTDIAANGVSVSFPDPVPAGAAGLVRFDLLVDGKITPIQVRARVSHCIFSQGGFKVGLEFANLDPASNTALQRFLR